VTARNLGIAIIIEAHKAIASRVLTFTSALLVVGVTAIATATTTSAVHGNQQLAAKLGPSAAYGGWTGLLAVADQVTAAAAVGAFGIGLSWLFGREFADGTITGLFALPVTRRTIALAKLVVYLLWTVVTAIVLTVTVAIGAAAAFGAPAQQAAWAGLGRLLALAVMSGLLLLPAALAATVGRGLLPGIATTAILMVTAQIVLGASNAGAWFPFAAPALWAVQPGSTSPAQLAMSALVAAGFGLLTVHAWHRLQLDRT
jgi:ABC-2 type transport system permease protein